MRPFRSSIPVLLAAAALVLCACASAPDVPAEPTPIACTACGSPDSDLYGCTSAICCARTGVDCGHATCICRPLHAAAAPEGESR